MTKYTLAFPAYVVSEVCEFKSLKDSGNRLDIDLVDGDKVISIIFESHLFYRKMEEGDAYKYALDIDAQVSLGAVFYKAEKSDLLFWLEERSFGAKKPEELQHFIIAAANDWIDVVAWAPPEMQVS